MKRVRRSVALLLLVVLCLSLAACSNSGNKLVGKWEGKIDDYIFTYEFTKKGEFIFRYILNEKVVRENIGTYKVKDDELTMINEKYDYENVTTFILKGNRLTIIYEESDSIEYTKVK